MFAKANRRGKGPNCSNLNASLLTGEHPAARVVHEIVDRLGKPQIHAADARRARKVVVDLVHQSMDTVIALVLVKPFVEMLGDQ